jgi:hypothetical protein
LYVPNDLPPKSLHFPGNCIYFFDIFYGEWRRLHNRELYSLYSSLNIIRVIKSRRFRWAGHVARVGYRSGAYRIMVGKPERREPLVRPRRGLKDNIKMDF